MLDYLITSLIDANPPQRAGAEGHPFRPLRAWDPDDVKRWLGFLAHHLANIGSRDLAWWDLRCALPRRLSPLPVGLAGGLLVWLIFGFSGGLEVGLLVGLA